MARIDELQKGLDKSSSLGSNLRLGGFNNPIGFTPPQPRSMFGASAQRSSQDFSRLQMPTTPNIPLGNTIPVFPDNYNKTMGERMSAPSSMVSGIRDGNVSGFSPYSPMVPSMGGLTQTPPMAPTVDTISQFVNPLASKTIRVSGPAGYGSTTLTPEQQTARFRENQRAEQVGSVNTASSRTPEQQQALLAQVRENGARLAAQQTETMKKFAESRGARFSPLPAPQGRFGQALTVPFPQSSEAVAQRAERNGSQQQPQPSPSAGVTGRRISQPTQYSNTKSETRKRIRQLSDDFDIPRPTTERQRQEYLNVFSEKGLI